MRAILVLTAIIAGITATFVAIPDGLAEPGLIQLGTEKPTREAIIAYNDKCKAAGVRADFISKFGGDFAGLDLSGVDFSGPHAVGLESNLRGANFCGANLRGANFGAAQLHWARFDAADLRDARFITANLDGASLVFAQLAGASLRESHLGDVDAEGVDFSQADITGSDFPGANLRQAKLAGATNDYWYQNFGRAKLEGADLSHVRLNGAIFGNANLQDADLSWAELEEADFTDAMLQDAVFDYAVVTHADFRRATGLRDARRRELMATSGRARWERERHLLAFVESPWFPLALVVTIPALAWLYRRLSLGNASAAPDGTLVESKRFQFTLSGLLAAMLGVAAVVGVAMWSSTGLYSLTMFMAGYLMVNPVLYDPARRRSAGRMLGAAAGYTVVSSLAAVAVWLIWPSYVALWLSFGGVLVGPIALMVSGTIWAAQSGRFSGLAALGFIVWLIGIGFANLWALAQLFASV